MRRGFQVTAINKRGALIVDVDRVIKASYRAEKVDLTKYKWHGSHKRITKSQANSQRISPPYSMRKLLDLLLVDEYHFGCIDAIQKNVIKKFECNDGRVMDWWRACQTPPNRSKLDILRGWVKYNQACGNGFMIKLRGLSGQWVGLQRLLPNETAILENYDNSGFLSPNFIQYRNSTQTYFDGADIIHMLEETHKSEAWGLNSLNVAANVEILKEIKSLDHNNFKNGMFIDYLILVEGLLDDVDEAEEEEEESSDGSGFDTIKSKIEDAIQNKKQHSNVIIETGDPEVKIRVEKLRKDLTADGQKHLEDKYKSGIFAYHRVPPRLASQETPGKLGGDNNSDLKIFYHNKVKPLQEAVANILSTEFRNEFNWDVSPDDFDFGNLLEDYMTEEESFFAQTRNK